MRPFVSDEPALSLCCGASAPRGAEESVGASPIARCCDAQGIPRVIALTPANLNDSQLFADFLDAISALAGAEPGRPRRRPTKVTADKGYDYTK